jgi:hypothetical protein
MEIRVKCRAASDIPIITENRGNSEGRRNPPKNEKSRAPDVQSARLQMKK